MAKKNKEELQKHREELKIRRACHSKITESLRELTTERLVLLTDYCLSLVGVDEEALQIAEKQAIQVCGYNPTADISEHDWAAMQKRGEEELRKENAVASK